MESTTTARPQSLIDGAKLQIIEDMKTRGFDAIIWDIGTAGFHYIPEIVTGEDNREREIVKRITGLYAYDGKLYAIEEGAPGTNIKDYYNPATEVAPTVVTLTTSMAKEDLPNPIESNYFTLAGSDEEWLVVADCYFEALNQTQE